MAEPLVAGAVQVSLTCPEPTPAVGATAAVNPLGAPGVHAGVAVMMALHGPLTRALRAVTRNEYRVPLVSSLTVYVVDVEAPSLTVVHVVPPSAEDWMT